MAARSAPMLGGRRALFCVALLATAGCHWVTPFDVEGASDSGADTDTADAGIDAEADAETTDADLDSPDGDGDGEPVPGPLVLVGTRVSMVAEPVCDVDGDGTLDSAAWELGSDAAQVFALALSTALGGARGDGSQPIVHFPWIDDLSSPSDESADLTVYAGRDVDVPPDESDDSSGEEPFFASADHLDPCGEPLHVIEGVRIDHGAVSGGSGTYAQSLEGETVAISVVEISGTIAPFGETFSIRSCGTFATKDLGSAPSMFESIAGLSLLEALLAGGAAVGMPTIPGLRPDVDLDGDGIESFVLDDGSRLERCIDGDRTIIEGRDCWQDPRIVDAFSVTLQIEGVPARYAGPSPGWEYAVPRGCDGGPPEGGFFSTIAATTTPCAGLDEQCDPLSTTPCCDETHRCSGGELDTYRCSAPCTPSECSYGEYRGTCYVPEGHVGPDCWPLGRNVARVPCTDGETGCTTEYGVVESTRCFEFRDATFCVESCSPPAADCVGDDHRCVPNAFEPGGVCAYEPGMAPS